MNLHQKESYNLKYQTFLNKSSAKINTNLFYIPNEASLQKTYYFRNKEKLDKSIPFFIGYNLKKKIFCTEDFFLVLQRGLIKTSEEIEALEKKLILEIQKQVDYFIHGKYTYLIKNVDFYKTYSPFKSEKEFHNYLIFTILKNLKYNGYTNSFDIIDHNLLLSEYFKKVEITIRENTESTDKHFIYKEINRLTFLKLKNNLNFLQQFIEVLNVLHHKYAIEDQVTNNVNSSPGSKELKSRNNSKNENKSTPRLINRLTKDQLTYLYTELEEKLGWFHEDTTKDVWVNVLERKENKGPKIKFINAYNYEIYHLLTLLTNRSKIDTKNYYQSGRFLIKNKNLNYYSHKSTFNKKDIFKNKTIIDKIFLNLK